MDTENFDKEELITEIETLALRCISEYQTQRRGYSRKGVGFVFPGKTVNDTKRAARFARVLETIHRALVDNVIVTKRDIYYRDPDLFGDQMVVDRLVESISRGLRVSRNSLNVRAAPKGLAIGAFAIQRADGEVLSGIADPNGLLVPHIEVGDLVRVSEECSWILVVEKEATFTILASAKIHCLPKLLPGIMVTGKGYPDLATRAFLRRLSISHSPSSPRPPVLGLVDGDPDGIGILSTYKYGSAAFASETTILSVPRLQWIGVNLRDTFRDINSAGMCKPLNENQERGLLRLTARDRRKAMSVLCSIQCEEGGPEPEWRRHLQIMLITNIKVEIQMLEDGRQGVIGWLLQHLPSRRPDCML